MHEALLPRSRAVRRVVARPLILATLAVLASSPLLADTLTFNPTKDVMAKEKSPGTNFGTDPTLQTSNQSTLRKQIFLQFTVAGLPAGATNIAAHPKLTSQAIAVNSESANPQRRYARFDVP